MWDDKGTASDWSQPAWLETGLLSASDWGSAGWVGKPTPSYQDWTDYTATQQFKLNSTAFGTFLRTQDVNNAYMWQLNVSTGVPMLRPHLRVNGAYSLLAEVDLRPFGFTAAGLLAGQHEVSFRLAGNTIETVLDGKLVDTRTATKFSWGRTGYRTFGAESVTISSLKVTKADGTVLASPDFGTNPFTAGTFSGGQVTIAGTSDALLNGPSEYEPLLRKGFSTDAAKTVKSARIYASAHGIYELSLNGKRVGDQVLAPGYTEYAKRIQSQTYDVTELVQQGDNAFGASLGDGWWAGKVGLAGKAQYGSDLALVARLKVTYTDGSTQWVDTDSSWKWAPGPFVATDNQLGETYSAALEQPGWDRPGFDEATWKPVIERSSDTAKLSPQPDEPVRQTDLLGTVAITEPSPGVKIYDLGQNMVGVPRVTITGKAGETVRLRHAEVLNPDGTMYTANLRAALATDYYTFATDGTVTYQPTFTQHGFRYIEITGLGQAPTADNVKGVVLGSDLPRTGYLKTSDAMLNKLHSNVTWGARGNFLSIPTDTPARDERLGWTGDISIFAPTASYLSDTRGFLGKWMTDVRDEQKPNGGLPAVVPSTNGAFDMSAVGWEDATITVPHAVWKATGDAQIVRENYEAMNKFFAYARTSAGADNLETGRLSFFTNDWLHLNDPTNQGVLGTAIWALDVKMMAEMAAAIGRDDEAADYANLYQAVRESFTKAYVASDGTVLGNSQTGYALALGEGLVTDPILERKVGEKFVAKLAQTGYHLRTGFIGTPWLLPALTNIGRDDLAYTMLQHKDYPSWGYEIEKGATTIWERWNTIMPDGSFGPVDMNSFNHYAYGAVADWMHRNIGGIQIDEPGYRSSIIEPHPGGGLNSADGTLETVYGELSNSWQKTAEGLTMNVTVPMNTTSQVRIPSDHPFQVSESGNPLATGNGIQKIAYDDDKSVTVVTVGSGTYSFKANSISVPPTESTTDYVDFGEATSENQHGVEASPSSGTSVEAGLTRRYSHNQFPGSRYSAKVKVPAGKPFLLRMQETWFTPGVKDYEVYVDGTLVKHVHMTRTEPGAGTSKYEILVDEATAVDNDGTVTVEFRYPDSNPPGLYFDPSIADLWAISAAPADTKGPALTWDAGPEDGSQWVWGSVHAAPTCSAVDEESGPAECAVTGYDTAVGQHTLTATAADRSGNSTKESRTYTVLPWTLNGFLEPVDMNGVVNVAKGGSTVPMKFEVFAGTEEKITTDAVKAVKATKVSCVADAPTDAVESVTTSAAGLSYNTSEGVFQYNWKTPKSAGDCYRLSAQGADGSTLEALFKLK
ncbi:family 78 glycoside hydrolase catalytic domain [Arthrobacter sp. ISL-69]|uniref:family 78 glycoside hydrolase catalytic domain n=1 Tax=Arthrobacter sp. ISL-69 TaxID=2819113 RepID=UPI001BEC6389|nr:family 78 glycoside hydrolase catalytic domain [Arthrobacter sp. ISL-69]MBT2538999.1 family 78 glycoside hydrolase catalytic domain [Arthrobacter sp. ISL-69]